MFAKERYTKIMNLLAEKGTVSTTQLMQLFEVSIETVRRDLLELEKKGALQRVHGGAVAIGEMKDCTDLSHRIEEHKSAKQELGETAAMLVKDNDEIYIDAGSTAIYFAESLKNRLSKLTVVTHSLDVFQILAAKEGFQVILCGGYFIKEEKAFYGQLAMDALSKLHVGKAFLFPVAISLRGGVCDYSYELSQMQQRIMASADRLYFLADSDKFEKHALLKICDMSVNHVYVTDSKLKESYKQLYKEKEYQVITSKAEGEGL